MIAAAVLLAIAIGNALLVVFVLGGWFIDLIYALPGFPAASIELDEAARRHLAADGMAAIRPLGPGIDLLREAQLPSGLPAFNEREIVHMDDVRRVVAGFAIAWLAGLLIAGLAWMARDRLGLGRLRQALADGARVVLALIGLAGVLLLVAFEPIFEGFHAIFFSGDTWRFAGEDTLLQLYPELFWAAAGVAVVLLIAGQCLALARRKG